MKEEADEAVELFSGIVFSGVCCNVEQVELETFSFPILFLLNLVGLKKISIGNSSGVIRATSAQNSSGPAIRAKSSEIYSPSAS